ncbi:hypothetical protein BT69DRAFT_1277327 [Atractiella rhizophila]|nr:hypothetical protein BT69DRAFT_1277327 [Atractiella rhizophila]
MEHISEFSNFQTALPFPTVQKWTSGNIPPFTPEKSPQPPIHEFIPSALGTTILKYSAESKVAGSTVSEKENHQYFQDDATEDEEEDADESDDELPKLFSQNPPVPSPLPSRIRPDFVVDMPITPSKSKRQHRHIISTEAVLETPDSNGSTSARDDAQRNKNSNFWQPLNTPNPLKGSYRTTDPQIRATQVEVQQKLVRHGAWVAAMKGAQREGWKVMPFDDILHTSHN